MSASILVMAGGTGGHVFPALAVSELLRERGWHVIWLGTRAGIEARVVPAAGIEIEWLPVSGIRGKGALTLLLAPFRLLRAVFSAIRIMRRVRPDVVLGMGGFASGPGGLVAWMLRAPLVIHEQNAIAGMTNRVLARLSKRVLVAFPETLHDVASEEVVGNPLRRDFDAIETPDARFENREGPLRILVVGGSLGARSLNELVPEAIGDAALDVVVRHQCGRGDPGSVRAAYERYGVQAEVLPFIDDMAHAYAWADVAICRAGAMTIFELASAGLGSVLVPFPHAVDDHQTANARYLESVGAAIVLQEKDLTPALLVEHLRRLADRTQWLEMARAAHAQARPDAARRVAEVCIEQAGGAA